MVKQIISSLVKGKKSIFNCEVKVGRRVFRLGGVGESALKVKLNAPSGFPHLDVNGFLNWDKYDEFTENEKALVQAFVDELPK